MPQGAPTKQINATLKQRRKQIISVPIRHRSEVDGDSETVIEMTSSSHHKLNLAASCAVKDILLELRDE